MELKVQNILTLDQMQEIRQNYLIHPQSDSDAGPPEEVSSVFVPSFKQMKFEEEVEEHFRFLVLHPSTKVH